jgi:hypothetical protein
MKKTIGFDEFQDAFTKLRPANFSLQGLGALWDYLEQYESYSGSEIELDVIAFCCDFSEDGFQEIADSYGFDLSDCETEEEKIEEVKNCLKENGALIGEVEGGFVYRNF